MNRFIIFALAKIIDVTAFCAQTKIYSLPPFKDAKYAGDKSKGVPH